VDDSEVEGEQESLSQPLSSTEQDPEVRSLSQSVRRVVDKTDLEEEDEQPMEADDPGNVLAPLSHYYSTSTDTNTENPPLRRRRHRLHLDCLLAPLNIILSTD
jgi:hypothetical protein